MNYNLRRVFRDQEIWYSVNNKRVCSTYSSIGDENAGQMRERSWATVSIIDTYQNFHNVE